MISYLYPCPKVSVVIPVHNRIVHTLKCLASLRKMEYPNLEIIVVDDGSTDGTRENISKKFPGIVLLSGDGNLWWTGAINLGISEALRNNADFVFLLNNDNVVDANVLQPLINYYHSSPKSIPGAIVLVSNRPDTIRSVGGTIDWIKGELDLGYVGMNLKVIGSAPIKVETLGGQGVLIHKEVFQKIGFFDRRAFPHYAADTDFYLRAQKFGYDIIVVPESKVYDDIMSTGLRKINGYMDAFQLAESFFSIKSSVNVLTMVRLFKRHCTESPYIKPLIKMYIRILKNNILSLLNSFST